MPHKQVNIPLAQPTADVFNSGVQATADVFNSGDVTRSSGACNVAGISFSTLDTIVGGMNPSTIELGSHKKML